MRFTWFNLMPWPYLPDDFRQKNRSVWVDIDSNLFDPVRAHELYNSYLDLLEYAGRLGYDGLVVSDAFDMGGLTEKADRLVGELAHGDQRAAEIMMSLALKPRLLLLDEPTAGMGDQETYDITRLIRRLHRDQKLTIVLIEHDMRVVFHLADRIMVLAEGAVLAEGTPAEIARNERVQAAYLGKAA